jgi:flavodoxin
MDSNSDLSRRAVLATPIAMSLMGSTSACAKEQAAESGSGSKALVAFFTRSGNTQVIAGTLHRLLGAELFQILPARAYPEDYEQTVEQARQERDRGYEPPLEARVPGFASFETVYLGFPIWGETTPPVIRSFLKAHDWSGKILHPFITHGGYGSGNSMEILRSHAPAARIEEPFVLEADQERRTLNQVKEWLGK